MKTLTQTMISIKKLLLILSASFFLLPVYSKIYINEISGNDKWLEIYNSGDSNVSLDGYKIEKIDEEGGIADWTIPSGTIITAKGFKSWERNGTGSFTWGISARKDVAFKIYDTGGALLDYFEVKMPAMYSEGLGRTVGRETDGTGNPIIFKKGTRDGSNSSGEKLAPTTNPKKLFINEINGNRYKYDASGKQNDDNRQNKWIEVYNAENEPVDLTNYIIQKTNEKFTINGFIIPAGQTIESKGFLVWEEDSTAENSNAFSWGISARKYLELRIFDENLTLIDEMIVNGWDEVNDVEGPLFSEGEGRTVGRIYDGAEELVVFPNDGTKGTSNGKDPNGLNSINTSELFAYVNDNVLYLSQNIKYVAIYNVSGINVLSQKVSDDKINLSHLPAGIYFVKVKGPDNQENTLKIVKN